MLEENLIIKLRIFIEIHILVNSQNIILIVDSNTIFR